MLEMLRFLGWLQSNWKTNIMANSVEHWNEMINSCRNNQHTMHKSNQMAQTNTDRQWICHSKLHPWWSIKLPVIATSKKKKTVILTLCSTIILLARRRKPITLLACPIYRLPLISRNSSCRTVTATHGQRKQCKVQRIVYWHMKLFKQYQQDLVTCFYAQLKK